MLLLVVFGNSQKVFRVSILDGRLNFDDSFEKTFWWRIARSFAPAIFVFRLETVAKKPFREIFQSHEGFKVNPTFDRAAFGEWRWGYSEVDNVSTILRAITIVRIRFHESCACPVGMCNKPFSKNLVAKFFDAQKFTFFSKVRLFRFCQQVVHF